MRKHLVLMAGIMAVAGQTVAQRMDVSMKLAYNTFITGEPVLLQVAVVNQTRDPIVFGDNASLIIEITKDGAYNELTPWNDAPFLKSVTLTPGNTLEHKLEADKWFSLTKSGKYTVRAVILYNDMRYESSKKSFDVVPGIPLKSGVQMFANKSLQRNFKLVYWARTNITHLFLRVEDEPDGQIWDTIDLGTYSRDDEPKLDIAPTGEITILHRATRDGYLRIVIWSLPGSVEIAERDALLDPNVSASQRVRHLYGDVQEAAEKKQKSWWKFW
ncbi:MAG: hypothetical protein FWG50_05095 [Kiritimatiellaeota bacterium]|nr:hypothetical protein [Kiritimatiellota bacterium]